MRSRDLIACVLALMVLMGGHVLAQEAEEYIAVAKALASEGNYQAAIVQLDEVISGYPATEACAEAHLLKGKYLEALERFAEARDEYWILVRQNLAGAIGEEAAREFARVHRVKGLTVVSGAEMLRNELLRDPTNDAALRAAVKLLQYSPRIASLEERQQAAEVLAGLAGGDPELEGAGSEALGRVAALETLEAMRDQLGSGPGASWVKLRLAELYSTGGPCVGGYSPEQARQLYKEVIAESPGTVAAGRAHLCLASWLHPETIQDRFQHFLAAMPLLSTEELESEAARINGIVANAIVSEEIDGLKQFLNSVLEENPGGTLRAFATEWLEFAEGGCVLAEGSSVQLLAPGKLYMLSRDFEKANTCADEVLGREPDRSLFISAKSVKRDCYNLQRRTDDALRMALDVVEAYPEAPHDESMAYLVWAYRTVGDLPKALEWANKVIQTFPGTQWEAQALRDMGIISLELGDQETALWAYQQIVSRFPGSHYAAWAETELGRLEE